MAQPLNTPKKQKNAWYIRDKGQVYKFDRSTQTPAGHVFTYLYKKIDMYGAVEKTYSPYGSEIPVLYRYGIQRQKVGEYFITSTVKFSPKDHQCEDCEDEIFEDYRTYPEYLKEIKRILTRFKIDQADLEDEMIVKITKKKLIYKDVGIRFTRVTKLRDSLWSKPKPTAFEQLRVDYPITVPQTVSGLVFPKRETNRPINEGVRF